MDVECVGLLLINFFKVPSSYVDLYILSEYGDTFMYGIGMSIRTNAHTWTCRFYLSVDHDIFV